MFRDAYTASSAGLTVAKCGASRACDAWRQLSDVGCSLRAENTTVMPSKVMNSKVAVLDKDLQGYITELKRHFEFYIKATGQQAMFTPQHKMFMLRMCSPRLRTHLRYRKAIDAVIAVLCAQISDYIHEGLT